MKSKLSCLSISLATASLTTLVVALNPASAHAQEFSLSIDPQVSSLRLPYKESTKSIPLRLRNSSDETLRLRIEPLPIKEIDKLSGRPIYQPISELSIDQQSFYRSAISYGQDGKKVSEVVLSPKQSSVLQVNINNNIYQKPSEFYFSLALVENSTTDPNEELGEDITAISNVQPGTATHFLVSTGTSKSDIQIESIKKVNTNSDKTTSFVLALKNSSQTHTRVFGKISIYNLLRQKVAEYPIDSYILGGEEKVISLDKFSKTTTPLDFSMIINTAELSLTDEASGKSYEKKIYYLASSYRSIIFWTLALIFSIYIARKVSKKVRDR